MGVSLYWQAVKGKSLDVALRSSFHDVLGCPCILTAENVQWLEGLAAGNDDFRPACRELIEAIDKHETVRVWGEW